MNEWYPVLVIGSIIGLFSIVFLIAYAALWRMPQKESAHERTHNDRELLRRLLPYALPYKKQYLLVAVTMLFSIAYDILSPWIVGEIEKLITHDFPMSALLCYVMVYAGILLISLVCTYVQSIVLQKTGQKIISALRRDLFLHMENLSHEQLHTIPVGKLVTRVTNDMNTISMMFTNVLINLLKNFVVLFGVLAAMLILNKVLTLMVLCFVPFILLFTFIFKAFARRVRRKVTDGYTDINAFLSENISGMKITQIFNRESKKFEEFNVRNNKLARANHAEIFVFGIFRPIVYMLYISSILFLLYLSGRGYIKETPFWGEIITGSTVVSFYMYISKFFNPIQSLADQFNTMQAAFASAEKIFTIFDMQPIVVDAPDAITLEHTNGHIEFRHVWFAYVPGEWVLKDVSFCVEAGQTVAFVGATGSGKTTILSLICRNYDIQQGEILIDGIDIRKIKISSLRRHFGQMPQDVFIFSGTIRDNLTLGLTNRTDEEIMQACRYVNADHFINRFSKGLDEEVRERGSNFSAGQRQLLSFARTILHRPAVMILDEATANIDTETERLIQDSLEKMRSIGTMLIVAHRLSTIRSADRILVLSHGEIIEQGSHEALIEKHGSYYHLYMLQSEHEKLSNL